MATVGRRSQDPSFRPSTAGFDSGIRLQSNKEQLERVSGLLPGSQGQNLAMTVLYVPYSLDSGVRARAYTWEENIATVDNKVDANSEAISTNSEPVEVNSAHLNPCIESIARLPTIGAKPRFPNQDWTVAGERGVGVGQCPTCQGKSGWRRTSRDLISALSRTPPTPNSKSRTRNSDPGYLSALSRTPETEPEIRNPDPGSHIPSQ